MGCGSSTPAAQPQQAKQPNRGVKSPPKPQKQRSQKKQTPTRPKPTPLPKLNYSSRRMGEGPRDVFCHICGRKYTVHSINLHIPQCEEIYMQRQEKLPASKRKPIPQLPKKAGRMKLEARNELAMKIYHEHVMETCRFCKRTFLPESLEKHIPHCAKSHGEEWPPRKKAEYLRANQPTQAPNTMICHICGRKYTTHSIDIHVPQCQKLWNERQAKEPPSKRKPCPQMPKRYDKNKQNEVAMDIFNKHAMSACKYCGRTFYEDRLAVHIRSCERHHKK